MCDICKTKTTTTHTSTLHFNESAPLKVQLCFKHDIELFKRGQVGFMKRYQNELEEVMKKIKPVDENINPLDMEFN